MRVFIVLLCLLSALDSFGGVFNTSRCFDLLCTPQYIDDLKEDARFAGLFADSVFVAGVADINSNCSASRLCNLYSEVMATERIFRNVCLPFSIWTVWRVKLSGRKEF